MNKLLVILLAVVLIAGGIWLFFLSDDGEETPTPQTQETSQNNQSSNQDNANQGSDQNESEQADGQTIQASYTDSGFEPAEITVNAGDTVVWTNNSSELMHVASDDHPEHSDYPGFDQSTVGQTYSFTFTEPGTWGYHNHEDHTDTGLIIVN